jgi:hypothetical protein
LADCLPGQVAVTLENAAAPARLNMARTTPKIMPLIAEAIKISSQLRSWSSALGIFSS